jgi:hypothetical protein
MGFCKNFTGKPSSTRVESSNEMGDLTWDLTYWAHYSQYKNNVGEGGKGGGDDWGFITFHCPFLKLAVFNFYVILILKELHII